MQVLQTLACPACPHHGGSPFLHGATGFVGTFAETLYGHDSSCVRSCMAVKDIAVFNKDTNLFGRHSSGLYRFVLVLA